MTKNSISAAAVGILLSFSNVLANDGEVDKSGTNPAVLNNTISIFNEYADLPTRDYLNTLYFRSIFAFADGTMNLRLTAPYIFTDAFGDDESAWGDLSLRWNWVTHVNQRDAWVPSLEVFAPTADTVFGTEKWTLAPGLTYARFVSKNVIIAPALVHNISVAGESTRPDINRTDLDLYMVYTASDKSWWVTADLTASLDYTNDNATPMSVEVQFGKTLGMVGGAALNAYVKPGAGIGNDSYYDWNLEVGLTLVGF